MKKMIVSKLYVPDTSKWIEFYKNSNLHDKKRGTPFGGSIVGGARTNIIPIEQKKKTKEPQRMEINDLPVKIISPSLAVVEQAETEIKRQDLKRKTEPRKSHNSAKRRKGKTKREKYNEKTKDIFD